MRQSQDVIEVKVGKVPQNLYFCLGIVILDKDFLMHEWIEKELDEILNENVTLKIRGHAWPPYSKHHGYKYPSCLFI